VEPFSQENSLQLLELQVRILACLRLNLGAGKTTLLNFLSGREISQNLVREGHIGVNGKDKDTMPNFSSYSAYV